MEQKNLLDLMNESGSVIDLEQRLNEYGYAFPNYKKYMNFLQRKWDKRTEERRQHLLETIPTETKFPTLTVEAEGIEYHLHGIVHGQAYFAPGWHPRKNVRDWVSEAMQSFHRPFEDEDYLYEQNMYFFFDLLRSRELEDITQTKRKVETVWKEVGMIALYAPLGLFALIAIPAVFFGWYIYATTTKKLKDNCKCNPYLMQKALTDERYQAHSFDFKIAQEMPQPFALEKDYLSEKKGSLGGILLHALLMDANPTTCSERSLWTAGALRDYGRSRGLKKLHYLNGMGHTTEIAYFLQHPSYSFERLEEYRLARK